MTVDAFPRRYPVPTLVTAAFAVSLAVTAAYWGGLLPTVPKTLPVFVELLSVTVVLFAVAVLAWMATLLAQ